MKNIVKGAVALGVGSVLMLGGTGTLAYWSQTVESGAGTITAGNLELKAAKGVWVDRDGETIPDITQYRVVPGDKLTYTQKLDVILEGTKIAAQLTVTQPSIQSGNSFKKAVVGGLMLKDAQGNPLPDTLRNPLRKSQTVTASTTFEFPSSVINREDVNAIYDFSKVAYKLEQVAQPGLK